LIVDERTYIETQFLIIHIFVHGRNLGKDAAVHREVLGSYSEESVFLAKAKNVLRDIKVREPKNPPHRCSRGWVYKP
jgi:hypothetical protein